MKIPLWLLWTIDSITIIGILFFVVYPNFYRGLTHNNYITIRITSAILIALHAFAYFKSKAPRTFLPLIVPCSFYFLLVCVNILKL
ncbi:MAG: hypothetical protein JST26_13365 [Bacteroidetes bacterium]|nr:hypothetical protein [Bacteroidota bacterium]